MDRHDIVKFCLEMGNVVCDYPFNLDNNNCAARHTANKKWFALVYDKNDKLCVNLKCDPIKADFFRRIYKDVVPGYHMNKTHWNTVYVNGDVPKDVLLKMIEDSFDLVKPKMEKARYFTYILRCNDNTLYCGYTNNIEDRVKTHNAGKGAKYTRARLPVTLVHREAFFTKSEALKRECEIKKMTKLQKLTLIGEI